MKKPISIKPPTLPPVRFSNLKRIDLSCEHYGVPVQETPSMRKGSATHAYLLGGESKCVVYKGGARNPKFKAWQEFKAEHAGKHILIPSELEAVAGMRRSVERNPRALELLDDGIQENRIEWDYNGRRCSGTPDVVKPRPTSKRVVELKTGMLVKPEVFKKRGWWARYPHQVDWYNNGVERTMSYAPGPVTESFLIAVESAAPHSVVVFRMRDSVLHKARQDWRGWFDRLLYCEQAGHFPGYADTDLDWEDEEGDGLDWTVAAE